MTLTPQQIVHELARCETDMAYFIDTYCHILAPSQDGKAGSWQPFKLWPAQRQVLKEIESHQKIVLLKARQLGITWLVLGYKLGLMVHRSISLCLLFSRSEKEAMEMLDVRLKGMYERLPWWMKEDAATTNKSHWELAGGSSCRAFATTGGDSYTATVALIDEADLCRDLDKMLGAIGPTIDGGGKLILVSRPDKDQHDSTFKRIYKAARQGSTYHPIFLPWHARPGRSDQWYADKVKESMDATGSLDLVHEQYPATEEEALAAASLNKRIPPKWLAMCWRRGEWFELEEMPGVRFYEEPIPGHTYVIGGDPAEGLVGGDDSGLVVIDDSSGKQVAAAGVKLGPREFANLTASVSRYYHGAAVNAERNNHGHAYIDHLTGLGIHVLEYTDEMAGGVGMGDGRLGYPKTARSKVRAWDYTADAFRQGVLVIVDFQTYSQLASIDRKTLKGPPGEAVDDYADAATLAQLGRIGSNFWGEVGAAAEAW